MSRRRPVRAWIGTTAAVDPEELVGPRGLTQAVLDEPEDDAGAEAAGAEAAGGGAASGAATSKAAPGADARDPHTAREAAFWWDLLTPQRQARILSVIDARLSSVTVVLDRLVDPHNTAAILRTAEGLGLCRAHVIPHEDGDDGSAHRRVTQDAAKWLDVEPHESGAACARALASRGFEVWAAHLDERARLDTQLPVDRPVALVFGNEHEGPRADTLAACTGTVRIPMAGFTQSFNVSVAAAMVLSQQARARRAFLGTAGDLPPHERALLQARFTLLAAKLSRRVKSRPRPESKPP